MEMIINPENVIAQGRLAGLLDAEKQVQMVSIDLTLAEIQVPGSPAIISENTRKLPEFHDVLPDGNGMYFLQKGCYTIKFNEGIKMPQNAAAFIVQRSTLNRSLATITASVIDPGYNAGQLAASLYVFNSFGIFLEKNCRIASIYFVKSNPAKIYNGVYQNEIATVYACKNP